MPHSGWESSAHASGGEDGIDGLPFRVKLPRLKPKIIKGAAVPEVFTEERCFVLEHWNDNADAGVSIARARIQPGVTTALHSLSVDERYLVASEEVRMDAEGLAPTPFESGDVVLVPAGRRQRITNTGKEYLVFLCICTPRFEPRHYRNEEA
jgi:mannose-6-phosphate isomerase-like protein (cupin superfamily)